MKSWVKLRIEGLNLDRQLGKMIKSGITAKNISRPDRKVLIVSVPANLKDNALAFFPVQCYNIQTIGTEGLTALADFAKCRVALILCMFVFTVSLFFLSGFVWRVEIYADGRESEVEQTLKDNGLWVGAQKSGLQLDAAENAICNAMPNVNYAIVSVKGCTVFVSVYQKETPSEVVDYTKPNSIYATQDGVISRILLISGTARVNVGDSVKKGQLLIEGLRTFPDGSTEPVCAVGEVYATVGITGESRFDDYKTQLVKTEEFTRFHSLQFLGFDSGEETGQIYAHQITECTMRQLFPLPITITTTTVYRAEENRVKQNFDDFRESCRQEALSYALSKLDGKKHTDAVYREIKDNNGVLVVAEIFVEIRLDTYAKS